MYDEPCNYAIPLHIAPHLEKLSMTTLKNKVKMMLIPLITYFFDHDDKHVGRRMCRDGRGCAAQP